MNLMAVQDLAPLAFRRASMSLSRSSLLAGLACASIACLAASQYLEANARIASHVNLPPDAAHGATAALHISAVIALVVGLWAIDRRGVRLRLVYAGSVSFVCTALVASEVLLWRDTSFSSLSPTLTGTLVLLTFPVALRDLTDRQILFVFSPLIALCAASLLLYVIESQYAFAWYNRWGLVAVLLGAAAAALTDLPHRWRFALLFVSVLSVTMSGSRQAFLGMLLLTMVWLFQMQGLGARIRGLLTTAIGVGVIFSAISGSERVEALGGIAGTNGRSELFRSAWSAIMSSPLAGLAGDRVSPNLTEALAAVGLGWATSAHNFVLDAWLRGGIVTAIGAVLFLYAVVWPPSVRGRLLGVSLVPFFMLGSELLYFGDTSAALLIALAYGTGLSRGLGAFQEPGRQA